MSPTANDLILLIDDDQYVRSAVATALEAQIADITSELGNVYMGGNSPTDHSLSLAQKNLSGDWNKETFEEALKQTRLNLKIRQNSITHSQPEGIGGSSAYFSPLPSGGGDTPKPSTGGFNWSQMPEHK